MYNNIKIALLGGDLRQLALARRLASLGFEVAVWGVGGIGGSDIGDAVRCGEWRDAVRGCRAVVLPLPASADGVCLSCPLSPDIRVRLSHIVEETPADSIILGGKLDQSLRRAAKENGKPLLDYFECEELQIKNAVPTAEGALAIALDSMPITMFGAHTAVVGYGRVGRAMAKTLKGLSADVTVAARSREELAWAEFAGCRSLRLHARAEGEEHPLFALSGCDVIFNTVPAILFTGEVLEHLSADTLIIDLAAAPGGVDKRAAEKLGRHVIHALSLPGKVAPNTAGNIICDCIIELLRQEGVIFNT